MAGSSVCVPSRVLAPAVILTVASLGRADWKPEYAEAETSTGVPEKTVITATNALTIASAPSARKTGGFFEEAESEGDEGFMKKA